MQHDFSENFANKPLCATGWLTGVICGSKVEKHLANTNGPMTVGKWTAFNRTLKETSVK